MIRHAPWHATAACAGRTELMYSVDQAGIAQAKAVCRACEHTEACLAEAILRDEPFGVWGGLDAEQRYRLVGKWTKRAADRQSADRRASNREQSANLESVS